MNYIHDAQFIKDHGIDHFMQNIKQEEKYLRLRKHLSFVMNLNNEKFPHTIEDIHKNQCKL